jgi:hypothetical protein
MRAWYIETTSAVICDGDVIPHVDCVLRGLILFIGELHDYKVIN